MPPPSPHRSALSPPFEPCNTKAALPGAAFFFAGGAEPNQIAGAIHSQAALVLTATGIC